MTGLGPEAMDLIAAARDGDDPTQADQDRLEAAIAARLAAAAAAGLATGLRGPPRAAPSSVSSPIAPGAIGRLGLASVRPWLATTLLVSVAALGVMAVRELEGRREAPPSSMGIATLGARSPTATPDPATTVVEPASVVGQEPAHVVRPPTDVAGDAPARKTPELAGLPLEQRAHPVAGLASAGAAGTLTAHGGSAAGDVAAEVLLLGEAHAAIRNGQAEHALALLDEHSRRFPRGALGEEREASRVTALCALGRVAEARAAADRFLRVSPLSPHAGRVRASCGGSPAAPAPSF